MTEQVLSHDEIQQLSVEQRLELIGELCESLEEQAIPLTTAQTEEIDRRLATFEEDQAESITWDELRMRIERHRG